MKTFMHFENLLLKCVLLLTIVQFTTNVAAVDLSKLLSRLAKSDKQVLLVVNNGKDRQPEWSGALDSLEQALSAANDKRPNVQYVVVPNRHHQSRAVHQHSPSHYGINQKLGKPKHTNRHEHRDLFQGPLLKSLWSLRQGNTCAKNKKCQGICNINTSGKKKNECENVCDDKYECDKSESSNECGDDGCDPPESSSGCDDDECREESGSTKGPKNW